MKDGNNIIISDTNSTYNFGLGSNGNYFIPPGLEKKFRSPQQTDNIKGGVYFDKENQQPISIEEVPSVENYYDGEKNLNVIHVECGFHHLQSKCLHEGACGWCEGTKKCISGNAKGPNEDCPTGTYIFSYDIRKNDIDLMKKEELVMINGDEVIKIGNQ